ncbi:fungal specific transcription factor domain protein [Colletotrichum chrysophilum]|uniref:Fungal specific transcription factor domain protein n=1 Tax=Colletotrichum chrysophilum TaxID=1836956 RepID=A0AAD9EFZ9_9PEZI|nr:fungal specific transcription factor domain protein [Colletotrichum chrysophilum]
MAVLLSVMAIGCLCMSSWKNEPLPPWRQNSYKFLQAAETRLAKTQGQFPPSMRHIQAVMLKCQFEVGSGRFNSAWMSLGCAVRLSQMVDIHREQKLCDPIEGHFRRCLFWAMFMIDRYLAAILGRPMAIHDSDVNMSYPHVVNPAVECYLSTTEKRLITGVVAHARLTKILGLAISRLYLGAVHTPESQEQIVTELEREIDDWLRDTPDFFHPRQEQEKGGDQEFYEVSWVLRRQQRTTQAAFLFNKMMIYRGYLLREFLDQTPSTPSSSSCSGRIRACVDNALAMVSLATNVGADECKYNAAFWTTSHFLFCATSILLVYCILYPDSDDTDKVHAAIEDAMKVHRELDYGAHINDQKLLEESCSRVHIVRHMNSTSPVGNAEVVMQSGNSPWSHSDQVSISNFLTSQTLSENQIVLNDNMQQMSAPTSHSQTRPTDISMFEMSGTIEPNHLPLGQPHTGVFGEQQGFQLTSFGSVSDFDMILDIGFDNTPNTTRRGPGLG